MSVRFSTGALHVKNGNLYDTLDVFRGYAEVDDELDDQSTNPVQNKVITEELNSTKADLRELQNDIFYVTPEQFGAVGDGVTDDSQAVQDAVDAGYAVYFASGKTYYLASTVTIDHDCHLFGGENTTIKAKTQNGMLIDVFVVSGTLKKTTTLTTDYTYDGETENAGNRFTLSDMSNIAIGDIMVITATDQYYNYSRQYYYLGGTLLIGDIYDGHLFTTGNLPYNIENTANVTVEIYNAPTAVFDTINFVGETSGRGHYNQMILLENCKNSIVRNCSFSQIDNGIMLRNCVNSLIEGVEMSKAKESNELSGDSYGIIIFSCMDTLIQRVDAICGQNCVSISGSITTINTYVRNCNLCAECRGNAIGSHENTYNIIIEDCTLTGVNVLGTVFINRCRFIKNNRVSSGSAITFCGSHNPNFAILKVKDCVIDGERQIYIYSSSPQNPIQSYDSIIGLVEVVDCEGGYITFNGTVSETILSNKIQDMTLIRWKNCDRFYRANTTDIIEKLTVVDCTFNNLYWLSDNVAAHGLILTNIYDLDYRSTIPMIHKKAADKDVYAEKYTLPENTTINFSSSNSAAKYVICGNNLASNGPDDYVVGTVSGSDGGTLVRTPASGTIPTVTLDSNGNIVYTQPSTAANYCMYPVGMFYVNEVCNVKMSVTLKNTGQTTGATFRPYIAIVDCATGHLISRYTGTAAQATENGTLLEYEHLVEPNCLAMCYFYCNSPVADAITTFEGYKAYMENSFAPYALIEAYEGKRRTGDGTIMSLNGVNNIMSSETNFHINFAADYINHPVGVAPSAEGVSF